MAAVSLTTFSSAFSEIKSLVFWFEFHLILFPTVQYTEPSIGLDNGLAPNRRQAIIWTNVNPIHWRIYAVLGGDEFLYNVLYDGKYIYDKAQIYNATNEYFHRLQKN